MNEVKDSIANVSTIGATGAVMFGFNDVLTFALLITGIILNIQRIMANNKKKED